MMKPTTFHFHLLPCLWIFLATFVVAAPEEEGAPSNTDPSNPMVSLRVIPVGAQRVVEFEIKDPNKPPVPIAGKSSEYFPQLLYIASRAKTATDGYQRVALRLNSLSRAVSIPYRKSLTLYRRTATEDTQGRTQYKYTPYARVASMPEKSHVLLILTSRIKSEKWSKPLVNVFDISPQNFPQNTCFLFNSSPFKVGVGFSKKEPMMVEKLSHAYIKDLEEDKYGSIHYKVIMKVGEKMEDVSRSAFRKKKNSRYYIFTYVDPNKGLKKHSRIAVSTEAKPIILKTK